MITQVLAGIFLFGLCIFFHELGHFLAGKWTGIQPKIFSIGYGRGIWFKRIGRTIYQITAIPLGGYVQFYGDDITREHTERKPGDFFFAGPWRRIIVAMAGPAFSLLLGFAVIFVLIASGWQPITNRVQVVAGSPAQQAGLLDGDRITSVNGIKVDSFEEVFFRIGLSSTSQIHIEGDRNGKKIAMDIQAEKGRETGQFQIGVRARGKQFLINQKEKRVEAGILKKDDKILAVNGKAVSGIENLRILLNGLQNQEAILTISRRKGSVVNPEEEKTFTMPWMVQSAEYFLFTGVTDVQTGKQIEDVEIGSWDEKTYTRIFINGESAGNWNDFRAALEKPGSELSFGSVKVKAKWQMKTRGMLGLALAEGIESEKATLPRDPVNLLTRTWNQTVFSAQSTLVGLYRIIQGRLSFRQSISGPVKIFAIAVKSVESGWDTFWFLLANITIILGIMNLLPIPVLDGGHVLFYLIEAIYKPLPVSIMAASSRIAMLILVGFGIYVIGTDLWDVFTGGWF